MINIKIGMHPEGHWLLFPVEIERFSEHEYDTLLNVKIDHYTLSDLSLILGFSYTMLFEYPSRL